MDTPLLIQGLIIGFSIAAPVGPIGVLCINRTLLHGRSTGLASGVGAATADAFYGFIAGLGLTFLSSFLIDQYIWLRLIGGAFLCLLGLKTALAKPAQIAPTSDGNGLLRAYASTFFLTLTNPMTILSFAAILAGLGVIGTGGNYRAVATLVSGVFIGSALWWLTLSSGVSIVRTKLVFSGTQWVNRISGIIITGFGLFALLGLL